MRVIHRKAKATLEQPDDLPSCSTASPRLLTVLGSLRPRSARWFRPACCASTGALNTARFEKTTVRPRTRLLEASNQPSKTEEDDDQAGLYSTVGPRPGRGVRLLHP